MLLGTIKKALINLPIFRLFAKGRSKYSARITKESQSQQIGFEDLNQTIWGGRYERANNASWNRTKRNFANCH